MTAALAFFRGGPSHSDLGHDGEVAIRDCAVWNNGSAGWKLNAALMKTRLNENRFAIGYISQVVGEELPKNIYCLFLRLINMVLMYAPRRPDPVVDERFLQS